jgi:hypothetical protein
LRNRTIDFDVRYARFIATQWVPDATIMTSVTRLKRVIRLLPAMLGYSARADTQLSRDPSILVRITVVSVIIDGLRVASIRCIFSWCVVARGIFGQSVINRHVVIGRIVFS